MARNQPALLVALAVDNFGSGLFLPLGLVYVTQVVGLPLAVAGTAVALGTAVGVVIPPFAGHLVDRIGPRPVVITAQLLQALGALAYLVARDEIMVALAAILLSAGQQLFYSSFVALASDVTGAGPKEKPLILINMVRSGAFGLGSLTFAALLTVAGTASYRVAITADLASFVVCAVLLAALVHPPRVTRARPAARRAIRGVLADRTFLAVMGANALLALSLDFFLSGVPVYVLDELHGAPWLPGVMLAVSTAMLSFGGTIALRLTRRLSRTTSITIGAGLRFAWCAVSLAAVMLPGDLRTVALLVGTVVSATGSLVAGGRAMAIVLDVAPTESRGQYLALFQYSFALPTFVAPAVVGLFAQSIWLPWLVVAAAAAGAAVVLRPLWTRLPEHVLRPTISR
ncbi:MAG TPA: MFS transporter [Pseudonocardiaceae bacterium]|nr:MFS transporter [Pseudonocardiaceae bacterium]